MSRADCSSSYSLSHSSPPSESPCRGPATAPVATTTRPAGPSGRSCRSNRHGKGKRWRVRYQDATGRPRAKFFERKVDAEGWDLEARTGNAPEAALDQACRHVTFRAYAERWRSSRQISQTLEYQRHIESRLRHHHYPYSGDRPIRSINVTNVLEWISKL
jgi:hypothetical protein